MTPEGRVKAAIKRWLIEHGIWFYMPIQNGMGMTGIPDFICCIQGYFLSIEAKAPGKRDNLTPNQVQRANEIQEAGGRWMCVDDVSQLECLKQQFDLEASHG